jgi:hypothetical protein
MIIRAVNNFIDYPSRWSWREHLTRSSALIVNRLTCDAHKKLGATSRGSRLAANRAAPAAASSSRSRMPGTYITKLPKAEHEAPEWQAAMQALILVRALSRHQQQRTKPAAEGNQKV